MSDIDPAPYALPPPETPARDPLWERALFMVLFAVIAHFLLWIFIACSALQLIVQLVEKAPNAELKEFMRKLLAYIGVTFAYLGFLQDEKPFPFSPFPQALHR
jgi:hypothetical protein